MNEPSDEALSILAQHRVATSMPAHRREANFACLEARFAVGESPAMDVSLPVMSAGISTATIVTAVIAVAVVSLAVWALVSEPTVSWRLSSGADVERPENLEPVSETVPESQHGVSVPAPDETDEPWVAPMPLASPPPGVEESHTIRPPARRHRTGKASPTVAASDEVDPLAAEVELLKRAQLATANGHPERALELLELHEQRFPQGRMSEAREVARLMVLCNLGRLDEVEHRRGRFLADHAGSAHAQRVARICAD